MDGHVGQNGPPQKLTTPRLYANIQNGKKVHIDPS